MLQRKVFFGNVCEEKVLYVWKLFCGCDVFIHLSGVIPFEKKLIAILLEWNCQAPELRLISRTNMPLETLFSCLL